MMMPFEPPAVLTAFTWAACQAVAATFEFAYPPIILSTHENDRLGLARVLTVQLLRRYVWLEASPQFQAGRPVRVRIGQRHPGWPYPLSYQMAAWLIGRDHSRLCRRSAIARIGRYVDAADELLRELWDVRTARSGVATFRARVTRRARPKERSLR